MHVSRDTVGVVLIATLAVIGLGLTAATIGSTYTEGASIGGDGGPGGPDGSGGGDSTVADGDSERPDDFEEQQREPVEVPRYCIDLLTSTPAILGLIIGFVGLVALAYRARGFVAAGFVGYLVGLPMIIGYGLLTQCGGGTTGGGGSSMIQRIPEQVGEMAGSTAIPPVVLVGVFAVAAIVAIGVIVSATRGSGDDLADLEAEEDEEPGLEEFAAVAGDAADRIESTDASVDNAVYRAWLEMTTLLDLENPDATTAGEFAEAAVDVGLEEGDVDNLTRLFEEVRYGGMDPEPREELALDTLRNIEDTYGDTNETDDGSTDDDSVDDDNGDDAA